MVYILRVTVGTPLFSEVRRNHSGGTRVIRVVTAVKYLSTTGIDRGVDPAPLLCHVVGPARMGYGMPVVSGERRVRSVLHDQHVCQMKSTIFKNTHKVQRVGLFGKDEECDATRSTFTFNL